MSEHKTVPVFDHSEEVRAFVSNGLWGDGRLFGPSTTVGFANEVEGLVAGFVYHDYDPERGTVELSGYSSKRDWANKSVVSLIFGEYPFKVLKCRLLVARHDERNTRVRRIWRAFGADEHIIPDLRADGVAEVIAVLHGRKFLKSRFMRPDHGEAQSTETRKSNSDGGRANGG